MQTNRRDPFTTIRTEGAILPADLLRRVADGDDGLEGLSAGSYHLPGGETLNEAIARSWNRLVGLWRSFQNALGKFPENEPATSPTRERWLLPLFAELGYGRLQAARAWEIDGKAYGISHSWGQAPIHLVGVRVDLDRRRTGAAGAGRMSPHGLLQEFLNRSEEHLWGFVSNGRRLRILRDNASLTRQAFVEFDLEAMMAGEVYADFVLLWMTCHQSRVEAERPAEFWLERWSQAAQVQGTRALDQLRDGVEEAIASLGRGFLAHPDNSALRDRLRSGALEAQEYYRQLLRLVYRLLFLFVAEDRDVLLDPDADSAARERYEQYYATTRLRRLAERRRGSPHADLFIGLELVMNQLGNPRGCPELALPALGSFLWSTEAVEALAGCRIANADLLDAIRALAFTIEGRVRRAVDYRNLGSEELGSVYESLLELHPKLNADAGTFALETAAGHERKTTGSYYTPSSLVSCLLDSALDPVLDEAVRAPDPEAALLDLKVCDPACGSGHFLIAAAHRIAKRLASVRSGEEEPAPEETRRALRDVVGRCLYGVDLNPMAVELCKVSLWMEALEPGRPLSFLDHHIQVGNSLLGATPAVLQRGIPNAAFQAIEGDDPAACRDLRKQNADERRGQDTMFKEFDASAFEKLGNLAPLLEKIAELPDETFDDVQAKERRYAELVRSTSYEFTRLWADAWCSAFVLRKHDPGPLVPRIELTESTYRRLERHPHDAPEPTRVEIRRLAEEYRFLHWHLAFPDVFRALSPERIADDDVLGWSGGFDAVLGNPPWERIKIQEKEWFAEREPEIAKAPNAAARRRMIAALAEEDPALYQAFRDDQRRAEGESHLVRNSGRYPLCGRGDINTYTIFAELNRQLIGSAGRVGMILPPGIVFDAMTQHYFRDLMESQALASFYHFENEEFLFPAVDHRVVFSLMTLTGPDRPVQEADFAFFARRVEHLQEEDRHFTLSAADMVLMNPNTGTCPIFRSQRDAEINKAIYRRVPVLIAEGPPERNPWGISFLRMLDMANDSGLFQTHEQLEADGWSRDGNRFRKQEQVYLPLYEAKMLHQFDHRFGTYEGQTRAQANQGKLPELDDSQHADPALLTLPRYWVPADSVADRLQGRWARDWLLGWRDICRNTDTRTVIASLLPQAGTGDTFLLMFPDVEDFGLVAALKANLASYVFDYAARQKVGGTHLKYHVMRQLPVLPPDTYEGPTPWAPGERLRDWLLPRVLELTYTAWDMRPFALDCDHDGPPFRWDPDRRFLLRCELDAAFFHLYALSRDDASHVLDTFPVIRRKDEADHGEYRTALVILSCFDQMAESSRDGTPYASLLSPPLADPRLAHPARAIDGVPTRSQIERGRLISYILLLLRAWAKPVARAVLEPAIVLMLNDAVRRAILNQKSSRSDRDRIDHEREYITGLDSLLGEMRINQLLIVETMRGQQVFRVGIQAPSTDQAPAADVQRMRETIRAVEMLGEERVHVELNEIRQDELLYSLSP